MTLFFDGLRCKAEVIPSVRQIPVKATDSAWVASVVIAVQCAAGSLIWSGEACSGASLF
jgi:hypothetical protein